MPAYGEDILNRVTALKNDGSDITRQKNKAMFDGALIGIGIGLYFGYAKKQNLLVTSMIGGLGGAVVGRVLSGI